MSFNHRHGVGGPVVSDVDGEYHYDHKHSVLEWQLPVIDTSNKSGSMEFSIAGHPGDFFPVSVSFSSTKSYCDLKVTYSLQYFQNIFCCLHNYFCGVLARFVS